jgi:short-subunit dehydrogenase
MTERTRRVVVFGATSAIAQEVARLLASEGAALYLVARDRAKLEAVRQDYSVRGARVVGCAVADLDDLERHGPLLADASAALGGGADVVLVVHGILAGTEDCERDPRLLERVLWTNFLGAAALCQSAAERLAAGGGGMLAVLASVAGDRGRASNYAYGAGKGGLAIFLEGLRARFHSRGVRVLTIKAGRIDTPMTAYLPPSRLSVAPRRIAPAILRAIDRRCSVVYVPGFWRAIMLVVRSLPEAAMRRLRF